MGFVPGGFDLVSISASLHHLADASPVFSEIGWVLRPGGYLVVAEMHRDVTTEAQQTSVQAHTWAASVDLALGVPHYPTLTRQQILDWVARLDLDNISVYDWEEMDSDPWDKDRIAELEDLLDRYLSRAQGLPARAGIEAQARALGLRLQKIGAQDEPCIAVIGKKP